MAAFETHTRFARDPSAEGRLFGLVPAKFEPLMSRYLQPTSIVMAPNFRIIALAQIIQMTCRCSEHLRQGRQAGPLCRNARRARETVRTEVKHPARRCTEQKEYEKQSRRFGHEHWHPHNTFVAYCSLVREPIPVGSAPFSLQLTSLKVLHGNNPNRRNQAHHGDCVSFTV